MQKIENLKRLVTENKREIKRHFIGWGVYYLIDFCFVMAFSSEISVGSIIAYLSTVIFYTICFYLLVQVYKIYLPENVWRTVLVGLIVLLLITFFKCSWDLYILEYKEAVDRSSNNASYFYIFELWRFSTAALYAFAYWIYLQSINEHKLRLVTEEQLNEAEVAFLKAQINPHFMFNTLNFVYADVSAISAKSGETILSLTKLLRYTVESTKSDNTSLKKEVDAIEEYLKLQNLRFDDKMYVNFKKKGLLPFFAFPPLILLSLVENAFKYGIIDNPEHPIEIDLSVNKEMLIFKCKNLIRLDFMDKETTSVGLINIERRLDMAYDGSYKLLVNQDITNYEVILSLQWEK